MAADTFPAEVPEKRAGSDFTFNGAALPVPPRCIAVRKTDGGRILPFGIALKYVSAPDSEAVRGSSTLPAGVVVRLVQHHVFNFHKPCAV